MDRAVLETSSDRYVIVEYLAEGGMGAIYLGKKLGVGGFEKEVVLKQLLPEFTREPKFIDLFLREARLSASLEHANIVRTVDLVNAGDDYFMVMEYVKGADLRTLLKRVRRRHQRFVPQAGVFIGHEILEALAYAHAKTAHDGRPLNLIHRDISPSNILLSGAGEVKLTDFGIAKASTHRSVFYKVKGKVGYMSPEQARGEPVDARSDLFSLGVVLYEVLVGERLFVGDLMSSASQIYAQPIKPPSHKRPEIPTELDAVILKALSLDPAGRFQNAEEFQEALTRVAARQRLLIGAQEMAAHLKLIAGEHPAAWLKLEAFGQHEREPTQTHGTAVLTGGDEYEGERKIPFDVSDQSGADDEDSDVDALARRNRPPSLPTGALTSVISVRRAGEESEMLTKVRGDEAPLAPLQARRSEPIGTRESSPRRVSQPPETEFDSDDPSRLQTLVRDGQSLRTTGANGDETLVQPQGGSYGPRNGGGARDGGRNVSSRDASARNQRDVAARDARNGARDSAPREVVRGGRDRSAPIEDARNARTGARDSAPRDVAARGNPRGAPARDARDSARNATDTPGERPAMSSYERGRAPAGRNGDAAPGERPATSSYDHGRAPAGRNGDAPGERPAMSSYERGRAPVGRNGDAGAPSDRPGMSSYNRRNDARGGRDSGRGTRLGDLLVSSPSASADPLAGRRLPKSGIRDRPRGGPFGDLTPAARPRPRRLIAIMIVLLLIGIGVALGVAFSGPELEVTDPTLVTPSSPNASTPATGDRAPAELPNPPPARQGTP